MTRGLRPSAGRLLLLRGAIVLVLTLLEPLPAQLVDDLVDDLQGHLGQVFHHAGGEGGVAERVDQPRNALGEPVHVLDGLRLEDLVEFAAGNGQAVLQVVDGLFLGQRFQALAQPGPLAELGQARGVEQVVQVGLTR